MADPTSKKKPAVETRGHQRAPLDPKEEKAPLHAQFDEAPLLTPDTLASYNQSHNRLLIGLTLLLTFLLSCFAISDPDIFFSLRTGQLIAEGQFPWGADPYGYAEEPATWVHPGWLGDLVIYGLYEWGGGPLLVLTRAVMMMVLVYWLFHLGEPGPRRFLTVLAAVLGIMTLSHRFYFRTELFSYFLLGLTFWCLSARPTARWLARLNDLTSGRAYWLLPIIMLLWVNLDAWFFLGVGTVVVWAVVMLLNPSENLAPGEARTLGIVAALCVAASFCSPFHLQAWTQFRAQLFPPTGLELQARFEENVLQFPQQPPPQTPGQPASPQQSPTTPRTPEQTRYFLSPWTAPYFHHARQAEVVSLSISDPLLPLVFPKGLSLAEWAYYPLVALAFLSFLVRGTLQRWERVALLLLFFALSALQSRLIGFFAVTGTAIAILNFQSRGPSVASLRRGRILLGQLARLALGLVLQLLSLLMLVPSPDASPSPLGHVHGRGHFGFAFRVDPSQRRVEEQLSFWRQTGQLEGRTFHLDWTDQAAYDAWFHPGSRHFFDRRYEVHSLETVKEFFAAVDAITRVRAERATPEQLSPAKIKQLRETWQALFRRYDISHIVVRRRADQVLGVLLTDRDEQNQPYWQPLRYQDGSTFVLAWTGSRHWPKLRALQFNAGQSAFRSVHEAMANRGEQTELGPLSAYLWGDAARRPAGIDEALWYTLLERVDPVNLSSSVVQPELLRSELGGGLLVRMGAQLATPAFQPPVPLLFSQRQFSASHALLALQAARRAVSQLTPASSVAQRAAAWDGYLMHVMRLSEYEAGFTPQAARFREPLQLFVLRQAAIANEAAGRQEAPYQHLRLVRAYAGQGTIDAAYEHFQSARGILVRNANAQGQNVEGVLQQLTNLAKEQFGFDPAGLEAEWKRRVSGWEGDIARAGLPLTGGGPREVLTRAELALRYGLPSQALDELSRSGAPTTETYLLACQVCMALGQYDVQLREYLAPHPELRASFEPGDYEYRVSLGWWCLGRPDLAANVRKELAEVLDSQTKRNQLLAGADLLMGTSPHRWGNTYLAEQAVQRAADMNLAVAEHRVAEGLLRLEAGQPQQAAEIFRQVVQDIEPDTPWRPLIAKYYLQITGKLIDDARPVTP